MTSDKEKWDAFTGTTTNANVDNRPDRFFCRACGEVWASRGPTKTQPGRLGWSRCPHCGARYNKEDVFWLKKPQDKSVHLFADGICVSVDRAHLPAVWQNFSRDARNVKLAAEQGVDIVALGAMVPPPAAVTPATVAAAIPAATAAESAAAWDAWVRSEQ